MNQDPTAAAESADAPQFSRSRAHLALATGLAWLVWNVVAGWLHRSGTLIVDLEGLIIFTVSTFIIFALVVYRVRGRLLATEANRLTLWLFGAGFVTTVTLWIAASLMGMSAISAVAVTPVVYVYFVLALAGTIDWRVAWCLLAVAPLAILSGAFPQWAFELAAGIGFSIGAWAAIVWWRPRTHPG